MKDVMGIINLSENEENIKELTYNRPVASIPFLGRYRLIDFVLSNMVNAGIENVGVFACSKFSSIRDHLGSGKPWDLDRKIDRLFLLSPELQNYATSIQEGDLKNFKDHLDYIKRSRQEYVILSKSYMVFNMDYSRAFEYHKDSGADITIIYKRECENIEKFLDCDTLNLDEKGNVISLGTNMGAKTCSNISMEMYIMKKQILVDVIEDSISKGYAKNLKDVIFMNIENYNVNSYEYKGYLACINSLKNYYDASMEILNTENSRELFSKHGLIYTKVKDEAPTRYGPHGNVKNSLVANGCIIDGDVESSIIFRGVRIKKGSCVKNSIVMQRSELDENANIENAILDKHVVITKGKELKGDIKSPIVIRKGTVI